MGTRRSVRLGLAGLLVANLVSVAGGALSVVALPWFVLATTGSTVAAGLAALCGTLPAVAVSVVAGGVVDRVGAFAARVGSDVVSAGTVLAIPALHATVGIAFWQLLVLVAVNGAVRAPAPAASLVLLNALSTAAGSSGDRARAAYVAGIRLAAVVGVPVGGAVIAWRGAPAALVADAATFAVSALILAATMRLPRTPGAPTSPATGTQRPWAGLAMLARDPVLRVMTSLLILSAVLYGAWESVLAPAYGQRVLHDPTVLGLLLGVFSAGAVVGNLAYPWMATRTDHHLLVWTCLAGETVLGYGTPAATAAVPSVALGMLLAGVGVGVLSPLWLALLTTRTAAHRHGHVFGVTFALEQAGTAVGAPAGGIALAHFGMTGTLAGAAAIGAALAAFAAIIPPLKALH